MKTKIWYAADGRDVQVRQMSDEHIRNCMELIVRKAVAGIKWRVRYYRPLRKEMLRRG